MEWAAGLFEGEGAVTRNGTRPRLAVKMTSEESVRRFAIAVDVGKVYGPYGPYQPNRSPYWMWVGDGAAAKTVAALLAPFASSRLQEKLLAVQRW